MDKEFSEHSQAQHERLAFIELNLWFLGEIRRQSLVRRFQIKTASATRDLALYATLAPCNLSYDSSAKSYFISDQFSPLYQFSPDRVLTWLSQGFADGVPSIVSAAGVPAIQTARIGQPNLVTLGVVTRAIFQRLPLKMGYESLNGTSERVIVPHALVDNGLRWHVRGFDRKSSEFRDFVITRILDPVIDQSGAIAPHEAASNDDASIETVVLELVPHPDQPRPEVTRLDYGMVDDLIKITVPALIAGYTLRQWSVDCSPDHSLRGHEFRLWLRNWDTLNDVDNALLAPGYIKN
jgi:hypothetical protein